MRGVISNNIREQMVEGMEVVATTVAHTMGPKGKNVAIDNGGTPLFTNDGVTVAREIIIEGNKLQNMGASIIKEACEKTNKQAGDGTTTTAILTHAIAKEGIQYINKGTNPFHLAKALKDVGEEIIDIVKSQGRGITTKEEVEQVATISSQDPAIGKLLADIIDEVGNNGTVTVEEGQGVGITHDIKKGMQFDTGVISPYMLNPNTNSILYTKIPVLVTDKVIDNFKQIMPVMNEILKAGGQNLVIICTDMIDEALASVNLNKIKGNFNCIAIKAPGFGALKYDLLQDIATITGTIMYTDQVGDKLEDVTMAALGTIDKISATYNETIITQDFVLEEDIEKRVKSIYAQIETATTEYEKAKHQERIAKLTGGIAVIKVGASTQMEATQKKLKIEDALNAARSAIEEGIVAGGGLALYCIKLAYQRTDPNNKCYDIAADILQEAIKYPYQTIANNAGYILQDRDPMIPGQGFNAATGEYCNMMEAGIIDPIKVIRVALENAISAATMLLTTEAAITELPEPTGNAGHNTKTSKKA